VFELRADECEILLAFSSLPSLISTFNASFLPLLRELPVAVLQQRSKKRQKRNVGVEKRNEPVNYRLNSPNANSEFCDDWVFYPLKYLLALECHR